MIPGRIGVFDSGVGGLTVAGRLMEEAPQLGLHYFGDTAHVPYGNRSAEEVTYLVERIVEHLVQSGVGAVVMACNTSNALAIDRIREWCPVPVVGIIEPAARTALSLTRNGRIGVISNPLTAQSGAYERACAGAKVFPVGCPKLVPLIEAGNVNSREAREALWEYLRPLAKKAIDTLILGCTHYPFLRPLVAELMGEHVQIVDPGVYVYDELAQLGVTRTRTSSHRFEVSGNPHDFEKSGTRLLGRRLSGVRQVTLAPLVRAVAG